MINDNAFILYTNESENQEIFESNKM